MHFALTSAAVHFCGLTAHLYEEQISIGEIAVTKCLLSSECQGEVHIDTQLKEKKGNHLRTWTLRKLLLIG